MAKIFEDVSRTFNEFLLIPNLTDERCIPSNVSLKTPIIKIKKGSVRSIDIANELKNPRGANIVVIGALAKTTDIFDYDYLRSAIDQFFLKKGKVNPKNVVCFDKGAEYMVQN